MNTEALPHLHELLIAKAVRRFLDRTSVHAGLESVEARAHGVELLGAVHTSSRLAVNGFVIQQIARSHGEGVAGVVPMGLDVPLHPDFREAAVRHDSYRGDRESDRFGRALGARGIYEIEKHYPEEHQPPAYLLHGRSP